MHNRHTQPRPSSLRSSPNPINIELATKEEDILGDGHLPTAIVSFDDPVKDWKSGELMQGFLLKSDFLLGVVLHVNFVNGRREQKFMINKPITGESVYDPEKIEFTEVEVSQKWKFWL